MTAYLRRANRGILTNWNSVADPAPASAFLSAPAGTRNITLEPSDEVIYYRPREAVSTIVHHEVHQWCTLYPMVNHFCPVPLLWQLSLCHPSELTVQTAASSRKAAQTTKSELCALHIGPHFPSSYLHASDQHLAYRDSAIKKEEIKNIKAHRRKK